MTEAKKQITRLPTLLALGVAATVIKKHLGDASYDSKSKKVMEFAIKDLNEQYNYQGENSLNGDLIFNDKEAI